MDENKIQVVVESGHPKMEIKFNDEAALTADIENCFDTPHDSVYISLRVDGKEYKKDIACLKNTDDPNVIRLCIFVNVDPDNPDKTVHEDPVHEVYLNVDEIKEDME